MNNKFIISPNDSKLYNYYWDQIQKSAKTFNGVEDIKQRLTHKANNAFAVKMLSPQMTNELCKAAVCSVLMEIIRSSNDIGYALEFLKDGAVNTDPLAYTTKLVQKIQKTLSLTLSDITGNNKVIDIDNLRNSLKTTIKNFYTQHPEYRGTSIPVEELQDEITQLFEDVFELTKTLNPDKNDSFNRAQ